MIGFWIAATAMAALALGFVVPRLMRGARDAGASPAASEAQRKLASLEQALADGHLTRDEYARRRERLAATLPEAPERAPTATATPVTAWALLILTPLAAVALYLQVGNPGAIPALAQSATPAPAATAHGDEVGAPELTSAITQLAARLAQDPDDVNGWFLLGRSYMAVDRYTDARGAFKRALELVPGEPALMVEYAEAIAFADGQGRLPEQSETLLRAALELEPESQKALWMLGIAAFQRRDYDAALENWQHLERLLEPDSPVARQLAGQIAEARAARGDTPEPSAPAIAVGQPAPEPTAAPIAVEQPAPEPLPAAALEPADGDAPALTIEVSLAEELRARVAPGDTLFVFARAVSGPRVPLAIQRLPAAELPARVRLDDTMGMMPSMTLATFPEVIVGARISKSGNAVPQPGDFEALSGPVSNRSREPVRLHIDKVL